MPNDIPTAVRNTVRERDRSQCQRCGTRGTEAHHRRSRRIRGEHCHCPCNLVYLCSTCHRWATVNVADARDAGWVVSAYVDEPGTVAVPTFAGTVRFLCDGGVELAA